MDTHVRVRVAGWLVASLMAWSGGAFAEPDAFGNAISEQTLTETRGGTEVINDMTLSGVVAGNQAYNLNTGNNTVTEGAMASASGMPTLIQNSGNNVLIQNATIVNVQLQ